MLADVPDFVPSVFDVDTLIARDVHQVWPKLIDYARWNPSFIESDVRDIRGTRNAEGSLVEITKYAPGSRDTVISRFQCETVRLVKDYTIVWYISGMEGDATRSFVTFLLLPAPEGTIFRIYYCAQDRIPRADIEARRAAGLDGFRMLGACLKDYCEQG